MKVKKKSPKTKSAVGRFQRSIVMWMRRVHLYSGLFMFPWVLMYAVSGWFFNHPRILTGDQVTTFSSTEIESVGIDQFPSANEAARSAVESINARLKEQDNPEVVLSSHTTPGYRDHLTFTVDGEKASHFVTINPSSGNGHVRTTYSKEPPKPSLIPNPIAGVNNVQLEHNPFSQLRSRLPDLLGQMELDAGDRIQLRGQSRVVFAVESVDHAPVIVTYNYMNGNIRSIVDQDRRTLSKKSLLEKLHLSKGYRPEFGTRVGWAILVDLMVVSMMFWGVSGLFMWWQVKRTRNWGIATLAVSVVLASTMVVKMHDSLTEVGPKPRASVR